SSVTGVQTCALPISHTHTHTHTHTLLLTPLPYHTPNRLSLCVAIKHTHTHTHMHKSHPYTHYRARKIQKLPGKLSGRYSSDFGCLKSIRLAQKKNVYVRTMFPCRKADLLEKAIKKHLQSSNMILHLQHPLFLTRARVCVCACARARVHVWVCIYVCVCVRVRVC